MPLKDLAKYTDVFVETGTFHGDGVQMALNAGYKRIVSIEIHPTYFEIGTSRFVQNPNVQIVLGDSALLLGNIIKHFNEPITFWLDGHNSGQETGTGIKIYPLLEELEHIRKHSIKNHVIMIDDIRLWREYDSELNFDSVINKLLTINPEYSFYTTDGVTWNEDLIDDILIAKMETI